MSIFCFWAYWIKKVFKVKLSSKDVGVFGEAIAANFLKKNKKLKILERNWIDPSGRVKNEIDIIAKDKDVLVFVEVKTRTEGGLVPGYYSVNTKKKEALLKVCKVYLRKKRKKHSYYRFDVLEVRLCQNYDYRVIHYTNVPLFPKHFA